MQIIIYFTLSYRGDATPATPAKRCDNVRGSHSLEKEAGGSSTSNPHAPITPPPTLTPNPATHTHP